ncbi:MAG: hypothetical protein Q7R52_00980 [archaeon]|nr:hypothetical protein [archaeon]
MKIENIAFWIIICLIVGVAIWKMVGSPTDTTALIAIALFVAGSEIVIWKTLFKIDKKTEIGFIKIKNDINNLKEDINKKHQELKQLIKK